jgi:hypothetical protein
MSSSKNKDAKISEAVELHLNNMASRLMTDSDCYSNKCANICWPVDSVILNIQIDNENCQFSFTRS